VLCTIHQVTYGFLFCEASALEGALQNRPGTDYFERSCDPSISPKSAGTTQFESLTASTPDGITAAGFTGIDPSRTFAPQGNF